MRGGEVTEPPIMLGSAFHPHVGQIIVPGLGLNKSLHFELKAQGVQIVHDEHPQRSILFPAWPSYRLSRSPMAC